MLGIDVTGFVMGDAPANDLSVIVRMRPEFQKLQLRMSIFSHEVSSSRIETPPRPLFEKLHSSIVMTCGPMARITEPRSLLQQSSKLQPRIVT